jgi:hypothetical protein
MKLKNRLGESVRLVKSTKSPKGIAFSLVEFWDRQWGALEHGREEGMMKGKKVSMAKG